MSVGAETCRAHEHTQHGLSTTRRPVQGSAGFFLPVGPSRSRRTRGPNACIRTSTSEFSAPRASWASSSSGGWPLTRGSASAGSSASERSEGKRYRDVVSWRWPSPIPHDVADLIVAGSSAAAGAPRVLFSALDAAVAGDVEEAFARAGHVVISNARNHRMAADVPLLVPEINPSHTALVDTQRRTRAWPGAIVTNPNCSTAILDLALAPLRVFGLEQVDGHDDASPVGRGLPGCAVARHPRERHSVHRGRGAEGGNGDPKIFGFSTAPAWLTIRSSSARRRPACRWPTGTRSSCRPGCRSGRRLRRFEMRWPGTSAPDRGRPSVGARAAARLLRRRHPAPAGARRGPRRWHDGVGRASCARVRCSGIKFVALGDNTVRGAAGAAILNAELLAAEGRLS